MNPTRPFADKPQLPDFKHFVPRTADRLHRPEGPARWLWDGYIAAGSITLLTSLWKSGKTTLLSHLLAQMSKGGALAGQTVQPGKVVVVSEESEDLWSERHARLNFGDNVSFICRPFRGPSTTKSWEELLTSLYLRQLAYGLDLVVIDPLASILPLSSESHASRMLSALAALQILTAKGLAAFVLHHPRKAHSAAGFAARGTGALSGAVDISIEMSLFDTSNPTDRRRKLTALSRHSTTPPSLVIELNADGTEYRSLGAFTSEAPEIWWTTVQSILAKRPEDLTRHEIIATWPTDQPVPNEVTMWRWLDRAVATAQIARSGSGKRANPFRYWLAGNTGASV
jgi:AAA domain